MSVNGLFGLVAVVVSLILMGLVSRSEAQLGCSTDLLPGVPIATCEIAADCGPVGGVDCTAGGVCACPVGIDSPVCPCLVQKAPAPALSQRSLIGLAGLLSAVGLLGLWRRTGASRRNTA